MLYDTVNEMKSKEVTERHEHSMAVCLPIFLFSVCFSDCLAVWLSISLSVDDYR